MHPDIAIVGGGAVGLAAAVFVSRLARERGLTPRVCLLEKAARVGRKLLATGNGTCNITNLAATPDRYHGAAPAFVAPALQAFPPRDTMAFFHSIGLCCETRENGRVYPLCAQAGAVLDCLRAECAALGVEERCGAEVTAIQTEKSGFRLTVGAETLRARQVLLAAGGAASPSLGGGVSGYALLTALGYAKTALFPSIVQVRTDTTYLRAMKGIRVEGEIAFWRGERQLAAETGEILFTEYGLSGPAVMQISRIVGDWERTRRGELTARLNLLPGWTREQVQTELSTRRKLAGRTLEELLTGLLQKRVGQTVLRAAGVLPLSRPAISLTAPEQERIAEVLTGWTVAVTGTQGFGGAQVTAGGIATDGFDPATMQSRRHPGLYAAGEILDIDGDCGGFNLQWAWASAHAAAVSMAERLVAR